MKVKINKNENGQIVSLGDVDAFEQLYQKHGEFVKRKFPQITDFKGPLNHLLEEVEEAIESGEEEEFADMQLLILSAFRLRFPDKSTADLIEMCLAKLKVAEGREWGEVNDKGYINHIRIK